jgi:hypothetical protein
MLYMPTDNECHALAMQIQRRNNGRQSFVYLLAAAFPGLSYQPGWLHHLLHGSASNVVRTVGQSMAIGQN